MTRATAAVPGQGLGALTHQVHLHLQTGVLDESVQAVRAGLADLCVAPPWVMEDLETAPCGQVELVAVVAPTHPLAQLGRPVRREELDENVHLVLPTERSVGPLVRGGSRAWHVSDLYARHGLLRAGVGWSRLPTHQVEGDLASGRLVRLQAEAWPEGGERFPLSVGFARSRPPGPAGRSLIEALTRRARAPQG